jgi:hypothetical protein
MRITNLEKQMKEVQEWKKQVEGRCKYKGIRIKVRSTRSSIESLKGQLSLMDP